MDWKPSIEKELAERLGKISEPILLYDGKIICPMCGKKSLRLREYLYDVPYFNRIIISVGKCDNCGYFYRDVRLAEITTPKKITVHVHGEKELHYIIVKSAYAYLTIPEGNYEMIPGPASQGFITTVEGVLHRFIEALRAMCRKEDEEGCKVHRKWLEEAIEGRREFTLILCDFEGASKVIGENVEEAQLDEFCNGRKPEWMKGRA